jgi:hypothetical protein
MNPILAGQLRHVLTGIGGAVTGMSFTAESLEAAIGGLVLWGIGQAWSAWGKRA